MATLSEHRSADPLVPIPFTVRDVVRETADTWTLALDPQDGRSFDFEPGQFNMVYAFGTGEVPISISGDCGEAGRLVHTVRAVGAATAAICAAQPGTVLGVRGPFGTSWPVGRAIGGDAVVVAGGIGLAPLRPIVYRLISQRDRFRRAVLLYGGRTPDQLLYMEEIQRWREAGVEVDLTVDAADESWGGSVGVVPALIERAGLDAQATTAYVCGPEVMIEFACAALGDLGVPGDRVYVSLERNMKCAIGQCGHCQFGSEFICRDGPVFTRERVRNRMRIREL